MKRSLEITLKKLVKIALIGLTILFSQAGHADENLLGYIKGSETLPVGSWEIYEVLTNRNDKGAGSYQAYDSKTEVEYGVTDKFSASAAFKMMSLDTSGIRIDGYMPKDNHFGMKPSGIEFSAKYNFLSPAKDDIGFSTYLSFDYNWVDGHSGQDKDSYTSELLFIVQKYFLEGELIWPSNFGIETTYAKRYHIDGLPTGFEWPTEPEMEVGLSLGTGLSYRILPKWFLGAEAIYETEYETEVGTERWSYFAGPSVHYASQAWWTTLTWFKQIRGGGEKFAAQDDDTLHLIEKTKEEIRLKIGFNF
jgi:hypothetical protein